ncbi:MAG: SDR family oxidoreductase [Bdellovibrionota bacterium]
MTNLQGKWAVVTGASSGIGWDIAHVLAEKGMNIIPVARREDRLQKLAGELREKHKVDAKVLALDLGKSGAPQELYDKVKGLGVSPEILINNAGFGIKANFADTSWERTEQLLNLNLVNLTHLTKLFLTDMLKRDSGYILEVASIGAYQPTPTYATYAAAKSYVLNFGEALNYELKNTGVGVSVLTPGGTLTEFMQVAGQEGGALVKLTSMTSRSVAEIAVRGLLRRKPNILPGFRNWFTAFLTRFTPRRMTVFLAEWVLRDPKALKPAA